jgi:hypothetical protein
VANPGEAVRVTNPFEQMVNDPLAAIARTGTGLNAMGMATLVELQPDELETTTL